MASAAGSSSAVADAHRLPDRRQYRRQPGWRRDRRRRWDRHPERDDAGSAQRSHHRAERRRHHHQRWLGHDRRNVPRYPKSDTNRSRWWHSQQRRHGQLARRRRSLCYRRRQLPGQLCSIWQRDHVFDGGANLALHLDAGRRGHRMATDGRGKDCNRVGAVACPTRARLCGRDEGSSGPALYAWAAATLSAAGERRHRTAITSRPDRSGPGCCGGCC